jgi:DNA-binding NarL/FixJ family response regulator
MRASASRSQFRVAIVDDHLLFAEAMEIALGMERYAVRRVRFSEVGSMAATAAAVQRLHAQVALLDLDLGRIGDGIALIEPLTQADTAVVVVTGSADRSRWGECLHLGAVKVLSKARPLNDILATVRRVHEGIPVLAPGEREKLIGIWSERRVEQDELRLRLDRLSICERDILRHLTLGRTVTDIAAIRTVSPATVRTQVKSILAKLEVSSQLAAVGMANEIGWHAPAKS